MKHISDVDCKYCEKTWKSVDMNSDDALRPIYDHLKDDHPKVWASDPVLAEEYSETYG
ncbi:hypothetical protein SEA_KEELAN_6 [Gordonia phage Keelan]|nr:hypothetical protein SEA_KEELAN_6 [Gordonia phage Keelan]